MQLVKFAKKSLTNDIPCDKILKPHIVGFVSCALKKGRAPIFSETVKYQAGVKKCTLLSKQAVSNIV